MFSEILQNSQENNHARVAFLIMLQLLGLRPATLLKKETLAQLFTCEFCEISKITFIEHFLAASEGTFKQWTWINLITQFGITVVK